MPYISVICPTMRVGGLDIIFDSLSHQAFKDFELIISDGIYKYRKDIVAEKAKNYSFPVKHIEPYNNPFPNNAFCRYANSGLVHADCELVVFITDYTFLSAPDGLLKHARLHMSNPELGYMASHRYFILKNVNQEFIGYTKEPLEDEEDQNKMIYNHLNSESLRYAEDVKSGMFKNLMWSLFDEEFNFDNYNFEWDPLLATADPKAHAVVSGLAKPEMFHGKNESCGLKNILKVGGWGEYLDGGHGFQDTDLADKLMKFGEIEGWHLDSTNGCYIINPRPIFPHGHRSRKVEDNKEIWLKECELDYPTKNHWPLKQINELNRMRYNLDRQLKEFESLI